MDMYLGLKSKITLIIVYVLFYYTHSTGVYARLTSNPQGNAKNTRKNLCLLLLVCKQVFQKHQILFFLHHYWLSYWGFVSISTAIIVVVLYYLWKFFDLVISHYININATTTKSGFRVSDLLDTFLHYNLSDYQNLSLFTLYQLPNMSLQNISDYNQHIKYTNSLK